MITRAREVLASCGVAWIAIVAVSTLAAAQNSAEASDDKAIAADGKRDVTSWFKSLDKNSDGKVERDEVSDVIWRRLARSDADGNGLVTLAEIAGSRTRSDRPGGVGTDFEVREFKGAGDKRLKYGWLAPAKVSSGEKYPLVLCLHGRGGNTMAAGALATTARREKFPCYIMAPACEQPAWWASTTILGRGEHEELLPLVIEAVRSLMAKESIDPARIYVTGQSMGGVGSWGAIARYPELFAAAAPVCGAWPVEDAAKMTAVPVWAFHGEVDKTVPVKWSRELTAAMNKAGGVAKYTEYAGVGHDSWGDTYANESMWTWMFEQRKKAKEND